MVTVNIDVSDGLANGVCSTVVGIVTSATDVRTIFVQFDSERVGKAVIASSQYKESYLAAVPIIRQDVHFFAGRGRRSVEAKRGQFPLSLAWDCTIHKVQGKTLDKIVVCMEGKARFMPGQAYVALSRVKKLTDLYLLGFDSTAIRVNPAVVSKMNRLREVVVPSSHLNTDATASLNIQLLNVRGYQDHIEDIKADKTTKEVDVYSFTETFLKSGDQADLIPPQAHSFRADRPAAMGQGGGMMTVSRDDLSPEQLNTTVSGLEYTAVAVTKFSTTVNIITIYRPPSFSTARLISKLGSLLGASPTDEVPSSWEISMSICWNLLVIALLLPLKDLASVSRSRVEGKQRARNLVTIFIEHTGYKITVNGKSV